MAKNHQNDGTTEDCQDVASDKCLLGFEFSAIAPREGFTPWSYHSFEPCAGRANHEEEAVVNDLKHSVINNIQSQIWVGKGRGDP